MKRPICLLCLAYVAAVMICSALLTLPLPDYAAGEGELVMLTGQVNKKEYQITSKGKTLLVTLDHIKHSDDSVVTFNNQVLCYLKNDEKIPEMGSFCLVRGKVALFETAGNPGQFDQARYYQILKTDAKLYDSVILEKSASFSYLAESLWQLKRKCSELLELYFSEENASVLKTMLLGEKGELDREVKELYGQAGIAHILAISGLHLSFIGMGLYRILRKLLVPGIPAAVMSMLVIYLYGMMTGVSTSSLRAIIMFSFHMTATMLGRTYDMLTALAAAAMLLLIEQPLYIYHSGFWFSFLAVLGIGLLYPVLLGKEEKEQKLYLPVYQAKINSLMLRQKQALLSCISVSAATFPVYLTFYYEFPLYSIFLNILVLPFMSLLMISGFLVMLLGRMMPLAAQAIAFAGTGVLQLYEKLCRLFGNIPYGNLILGRPERWQTGCYFLCLIMVINWDKIGEWIRRMSKKGSDTGCWGRHGKQAKILVLVLAVIFLSVKRESGVEITFLDVGQGDGIHIRSNSGRHYLMDSGSTTVKQPGKYRLIPYLKAKGIRELAVVFISHTDEDHINGIRELMEDGSIPIRRLLMPDVAGKENNAQMQEITEAAQAAGTRIGYLKQGDRILDDGMVFTCLHPAKGESGADTNAASLVIRMEYGSFSVLLTGDVEKTGEDKLVRYLLSAKKDYQTTILKVAHHGSGYSTSSQLLSRLMPQIAVVSCGKKNSYGHPHEEVIERLQAVGAEIILTPEAGAVTIYSDGETMRVECFRKQQIQ